MSDTTTTANTAANTATTLRDPITFDLDQPIDFPGQDRLTSLTIKSYTGKDLIECGMPFTSTRDSKGVQVETVHPKNCALLIARMACVPVTMIERMAAVDFVTGIEAMKIFFYYTSQKSSSSNI